MIDVSELIKLLIVVSNSIIMSYKHDKGDGGFVILPSIKPEMYSLALPVNDAAASRADCKTN